MISEPRDSTEPPGFLNRTDFRAGRSPRAGLGATPALARDERLLADILYGVSDALVRDYIRDRYEDGRWDGHYWYYGGHRYTPHEYGRYWAEEYHRHPPKKPKKRKKPHPHHRDWDDDDDDDDFDDFSAY